MSNTMVVGIMAEACLGHLAQIDAEYMEGRIQRRFGAHYARYGVMLPETGAAIMGGLLRTMRHEILYIDRFHLFPPIVDTTPVHYDDYKNQRLPKDVLMRLWNQDQHYFDGYFMRRLHMAMMTRLVLLTKADLYRMTIDFEVEYEYEFFHSRVVVV